MLRADNSVKYWRNLPLSDPKPDLLHINARTMFVKIPWLLLKLSSRNKQMGVFQADNSVKLLWNLQISNPNPDLYNINAHTKFGENPLTFTQVIIRKRKYGRASGR